MSTVYLYCAAIGGAVLVLQFLLLLVGAGGDHDLGDAHGHDFGAGHDGTVGHDQSSFLKLISLQTLTTFTTFFGLIGLGGERIGWSPGLVVATATAAGVGALWLVARAMHGLARLQSQGNVDLKNAIGVTANVYLRIPAAGSGHGRVLVHVQGRTIECRAVSIDREIPTGTPVRVLELEDDELLVVAPVE
ncbi:MAG: hypothetical protein U1E73_09125 [Planctomycetota bacterium]